LLRLPKPINQKTKISSPAGKIKFQSDEKSKTIESEKLQKRTKARDEEEDKGSVFDNKWFYLFLNTINCH
jgi:hypothetical protein